MVKTGKQFFSLMVLNFASGGSKRDCTLLEQLRTNVRPLPISSHKNNCHKILLSAIKKSATYHKIILYARKQDFRQVKAEYYVISGKHIKTAIFDKFKPVAGRLILEQMTVYDELKKDRKTIFEYLTIAPKTLPAKYFNKNYLIHVSDL